MWRLSWSWNVGVPSLGRGDVRNVLDQLDVARGHAECGDGDDVDGDHGGDDDGGADVAVELELELDLPL